MQEELQLRHLPRHEKKHVVRGWHATYGRRGVAASSSSSIAAESERPESQQTASRGELRAFFTTPPGATTYEPSFGDAGGSAGSWNPSLVDEQRRQEEDEAMPRTVAQVKHAYIARARREEVADAHKAAVLLRRQTQRLQLIRGPPPPREQATKTREAVAAQQELQHEDEEPTNEMDVEEEGVLVLQDLSVRQVTTDSERQGELLRLIRRQLVQGGQVLLRSDCGRTGECVSDARLLMQQLCSQSLAYCRHDQDVVPQAEAAVLSLRLLPRWTPPQ